MPCPSYAAFPCPVQPYQSGRGAKLSCSWHLSLFAEGFSFLLLFFIFKLKKNKNLKSIVGSSRTTGWEGAELCSLQKQKPCPPEMLLSPQEGHCRDAPARPALQNLQSSESHSSPAQLGLNQSHQTERGFLYMYVCVHVKVH